MKLNTNINMAKINVGKELLNYPHEVSDSHPCGFVTLDV